MGRFPQSPTADQLGVGDELHRAFEEIPEPGYRPWRDAALLALQGEYRPAADVFADMGNTTLEAKQRLYAGQHLIEQGSQAEGQAELQRALAFFRSVGATHYIGSAEALLRKSA